MKKPSIFGGSLRSRLVFGSILAGFFALGAAGVLPVPTIDIRWPERSEKASENYMPSHSIHNGQEVVMVYVGSSACSFANDPELPDMVEKAKLLLQVRAQQSGFHFAATGVSIDWTTGDGVRHLAKFGNFDEIVTGRNWQGTGARHFIWGVLPGAASTPQILVVIRTVKTPSQDRPGQQYGVFDETVAVRKSGVTAIAQWVDRGSPIPTDLLVP